MPLDATTLQSAIKAAFEKAKSTPPPADPTQTDKVQETILSTLSQDLANAIDAYVKGAAVNGIKNSGRPIPRRICRSSSACRRQTARIVAMRSAK